MNLENFLLLILIFYLGWRLYEVMHAREQNTAKIRLVSKKTGQVIELDLLNDKDQPIIQPINPDEAFVAMAKDMFSRIVQGFTTGNLDKIKMLITPKVFDAFKGAIDDRRAQNYHMDFTLVDFKEVKLLKTDSNKVRQVAFTTEQINLMKDKDGNVISGDPMYVTTVNEIWTFERQENNTWILTATKQGVSDVV